MEKSPGAPGGMEINISLRPTNGAKKMSCFTQTGRLKLRIPYLYSALRKHPVRGNGLSPPVWLNKTHINQLNFLPLGGHRHL